MEFDISCTNKFAMIGYNLMSLFRTFLLQEKTQKTLSTLRYRTFAVGAYLRKMLTCHSRDRIGGMKLQRLLKVLSRAFGVEQADSGTIQKSSSTLLFSLMRNLG